MLWLRTFYGVTIKVIELVLIKQDTRSRGEHVMFPPAANSPSVFTCIVLLTVPQYSCWTDSWHVYKQNWEENKNKSAIKKSQNVSWFGLWLEFCLRDAVFFIVNFLFTFKFSLWRKRPTVDNLLPTMLQWCFDLDHEKCVNSFLMWGLWSLNTEGNIVVLKPHGAGPFKWPHYLAAVCPFRVIIRANGSK